MAVCEEPDEQPVDQIFLAHDHSRNFILNRVNPLAVTVHFLRYCLSRDGHNSMLEVRHLLGIRLNTGWPMH